MMANTLVRFRESSFSPWGSRPRSGHRSPLPDASEKYSTCVGSISSVNQILSERGLQYPAQLPSLVSRSTDFSVAEINTGLDLSPTGYEDLLQHDNMANGRRRGKKPPRKQLPSTRSIKPRVKKEVKLPVQSTAALPSPTPESKLVELASFPGYDPHHPTPLPHGLDPLEQMQRTSRAQAMLGVKREGFRETWKRLFYKPASQAIFQDYFWWFFLHTYQNSKLLLVQDLLFNRISTNYVSLLCEDVDMRWRDSFFKVYPDAVAQCVYSAFIHAYPASWNSFDDKFKVELMKFISLWQVGTRPMASAWQKWNLSILEPANLLKHIGKEKSDEGSSSSAKSPKKKTPFELDDLIKELEEKDKCPPNASPSIQNENAQLALDKDDETSETSDENTQGKEGEGKEPAPTRISVCNFEEELAQSLANEQIQISASKEKLVKSQAQATRELLSKKAKGERQPRAEPPAVLPTNKPAPPGRAHTQVTQQTKPKSVQQRSVLPTSKVPQTTASHQKSANLSTSVKNASQVTQSGKSAPIKPTQVQTRATINPLSKTLTQVQVKETAPSQMRTIVPNQAKSHQSIPKQNSPQAKMQDTAKPNQPKFVNPNQPKPNQLKLTSQKAPLPANVHQASPKKVGQVKGVSENKPQAGVSKAVNQSGGGTSEKKNVWKEKAMAILKKKKESDVPVSAEPSTFDHVQFDIYGQSPLVKHYLKERKLARENETKVLVGRTEVVDDQQSPNTVSYKDIVADAVENGLQNHVQFEKHYRELKREMARLQATRTKASRKHEQDVKNLLSCKNEVRHLSNELAAYVLNKQSTGSGKDISNAIEKSLNRIAATQTQSTK